MLFKTVSCLLVFFTAVLPAMNTRRIKSTRPVVVSDPYSIFKAAERGNVKVIRRMIANGVSVDQVDANGNTPLIIAAIHGKTDIMDELIRAGANTDIKNNADDNAIFAAVRAGQAGSVHILLKAGVSPDQREIYGLGGGKTLLMIATENNNTEIVRLLVEAGANKDARAPLLVPGQDRTAAQMAPTMASEELKAYLDGKKEKLP